MTELTEELAAAGWELPRTGRQSPRPSVSAISRDAMAWMSRVGFEAEAADHHPEWSNVYNRVAVTLTTHDTGGLTQKDIALAGAMDRIAASSYAKAVKAVEILRIRDQDPRAVARRA